MTDHTSAIRAVDADRHDPRTHEFEMRDTDEPALAIVQAVAATTDSDPIDLPPLHDAIDADALTALVGSAAAADREVRVTFEFCARTVTVESTGRIRVT